MRKSSPLQHRVHSRFGGVRISLKKRIILGLIFLVGGPVISTTLATTLTITGTNGKTAIEFGQGSQLAIACDTTITTAITEVWETTTTRFRVERIVLSGLNLTAVDTATTNDAGCGNRDLKISAIDTQTGPIIIGNGDTGTAVTIAFNAAGGAGARSTENLLGGTLAITGTLTNSTITYTLPNPLRDNSNVARTGQNVSVDPARISRIAIETEN